MMIFMTTPPQTSHKNRKKYYPQEDAYKGRTLEEIMLGTHVYATGQKVTKARLSVLSALSHLEKPVSIKNLGKLIKDCDKTTLYRTLETMARIGLVTKVFVDSSEILYETSIGRRHHHHIT